MTNDDLKKLADERIEEATKIVAKVINMLEQTSRELKGSCKSMQWDDEVAYQIEDAATKLGYSLATLVNWNDQKNI